MKSTSSSLRLGAILGVLTIGLPVAAAGTQASVARAAGSVHSTPITGTAFSATNGSSALGKDAQRRLFSRTFQVRGHVAFHNPSRTRQARAFQRRLHALDIKHLAVFGRVVSYSRDTLIMRQIPWDSHGSHGAKVVFRDNWTPVGTSNVLVRVIITSHTVLQSVDGVSGLRTNTPVLVGGNFSNHRLTAMFIGSLQQRSAGSRPQKVGLYRALSGRPILLPRILHASPVRSGSRRLTRHDNNLNFTGGFGGPSFNYNQDLGDIDIFDLGVVTVYLDHFSFLASLDGWTYDWPFTFTGTTASPLTMTEQNSVNLNVLPQQGGNGTYTDTFSGGVGVDVGIGFHIYTAVGCGTLDLQSCDFYPTLHLGVGLLNETQDKAPLDPSQSLNVPSVDCPSVGFSIPDTDISVADVGLCNTFLIDGTNFSAHASATGATMTPTDLNFDGTNGHSLTLTPTSASVDVNLSNFTWIPTLHYGLHPRIRVARQTVWTGPTAYITSGAFPMIADAATRAAAGFNDVSGQFAQPSFTDFLFTASREGTHIAYTGPSSSDYHDAATLSATLTDNLSRPVPGKTLTFVLNNNSSETCTAQTDFSGVAQCPITPVDVPAPGQVSISFAGDAQYFGTSLTPSFTITKEETTLAYTGDPYIANNRPGILKAILKEDGTVAPLPAGQTITLTLGSGATTQTCAGATGADGVATCTLSPVSQPLGNNPVSAVFAGDAYYLPSSDASQQRLVFSYLPAGGAFALGNCTAFTTGNCQTGAAASTLTWWSSEWPSLNSLSTGPAPSSFKGFAATFSGGDPSCGGTWTTGPGDSAHPPTSVPSYTAMVVPSRITKSGSTISGDIARIVIVKTDGDYGSNPGHAGTGTIVGVLCGS